MTTTLRQQVETEATSCLSEACVWWPEPHGHVRVVRTRWVSPWLEVPNA